MSFYGKITEADGPPPMKTFGYIASHDGPERTIKAQHVYFYESGHIGFWNDAGDDDRVLVLAIKATEVWEEPA